MASKIDSSDSSSGESTPSKPLSTFTKLSKVVRLYEPPSASTTTLADADSPTTILFCSWMNAFPKHIEYYTKTYMALYPNARIIQVTINTQQFLFQSETTRRREVQEAVTALLARPQAEERLLVHALSNGGARRVYNISGAYREATGKPLPLKAFVVDSAPGIPQFRRDIHALGLPAKKLRWYIRVPYIAVVVLVTTAVYITVNCKFYRRNKALAPRIEFWVPYQPSNI